MHKCGIQGCSAMSLSDEINGYVIVYEMCFQWGKDMNNI